MPLKPNVPYLLCALVAALPRGTAVPHDMKTLPCANCDRTVFVSSMLLGLIDSGTAQPVCSQCIPQGKRLLAVMTQDQVADLRRFNRDDAERN